MLPDCAAADSFGELMTTRLGSNQPWSEEALRERFEALFQTACYPVAAKTSLGSHHHVGWGPLRMTLDGAGSQPAGDVREGRLRVSLAVLFISKKSNLSFRLSPAIPPIILKAIHR